jgi:hypothetical protein
MKRLCALKGCFRRRKKLEQQQQQYDLDDDGVDEANEYAKVTSVIDCDTLDLVYYADQAGILYYFNFDDHC